MPDKVNPSKPIYGEVFSVLPGLGLDDIRDLLSGLDGEYIELWRYLDKNEKTSHVVSNPGWVRRENDGSYSMIENDKKHRAIDMDIKNGSTRTVNGELYSFDHVSIKPYGLVEGSGHGFYSNKFDAGRLSPGKEICIEGPESLSFYKMLKDGRLMVLGNPLSPDKAIGDYKWSTFPV